VVWMFGGSLDIAGAPVVNELWKYSVGSNTWTLVSTGGPSARKFCKLSYDTANNVILLYGGLTASDVFITDTWVLNPATATWQQLTPTISPSTSVNDKYSANLAYDPENNVHVLMVEDRFWLYRYGTAKGIVATDTITITDRVNKGIGRTFVDAVGTADTLPGTAPAISIPLTIREVLPAGVTGLARSNGPVTVGVPIDQGSGVRSVTELGLAGVTVGQFRALSTYPNGDLKFVQVDFQKSLAAGATDTSVALTTGQGNFGGINLASTSVGIISISTGSAFFQFNTGTPGFRMFDRAIVGSTEMLQVSGSLGSTSEGVVVISGGTRYTSANDVAAAIAIEENGPARCCIKSMGALKSAGGTRLCDYTVRMHFYLGKSYCRAFVELRNASQTVKVPFAFDSAEVPLNLAIGSGANYRTKTNAGVFSGPIGAGQTAYVFQGYSTRNFYGENAYALAPMQNDGGGNFTQKGVAVHSGAAFLQSLGTATDYAEGWAALEDSSGKGVTMGLASMPQLWPAGFEMSDTGVCSVQLFSKRNSKTGILFGSGKHETREIFFDFHTSAPAIVSGPFYSMQYPLYATAALDQYNDTGAIFGEQHLVSYSDQQTWFTSRGGTSPVLANPTPEIVRYKNWGAGGGGNQTDHQLIDLMDYLRTGFGGYLIQGLRNTLFKADTGALRSDGWDYGTGEYNDASVNAACFNAATFDFAHAHWQSFVTAYHLTGNEIFREAYEDFGQWKHAYAESTGTGSDLNYYFPLRSPITDGVAGDMRIWSRYLRDFACLYDATRSTTYWNDMSLMVDALLASTETAGSFNPFGRNRERGFVWMDHGWGGTPRRISDFMTGQILAEACYEALRMLRQQGDTRAAALEDLLLGLAQFIKNELFFDNGSAVLQFGFLYTYYLDQANTSLSNPYWAEGFRPESAARPMHLAYQLTGDTTFLDVGARLLIGDCGGYGSPGVFVTARTPSDYPGQALIWYDLNRPAEGWTDLSLDSAVNQGNGTWRLTWTVPAGCRSYQIRYSEKTIVNWLGFNQTSRVYTYLTSVNIPWFAATRAPSNPAPAGVGTSQVFDVTGLDPAKTYHFAVRYQTSGTTGSTNVVKVVSDTPAITDAVNRGVARSFSDSVTTASSAPKGVQKTAADTVTMTDDASALKVVARLLEDAVTMTGVLVKTVHITATDTVTMIEGFVKKVVRTFSDAATIADALATIKVLVKSLSDTLTMTDSATKTVAKTFVDSVSMSDARGQTVVKNLSDTVTITDDTGAVPVAPPIPIPITTQHKKIRVSTKDRVRMSGGA
jgi:hypothetical protein